MEGARSARADDAPVARRGPDQVPVVGTLDEIEQVGRVRRLEDRLRPCLPRRAAGDREHRVERRVVAQERRLRVAEPAAGVLVGPDAGRCRLVDHGERAAGLGEGEQLVVEPACERSSPRRRSPAADASVYGPVSTAAIVGGAAIPGGQRGGDIGGLPPRAHEHPVRPGIARRGSRRGARPPDPASGRARRSRAPARRRAAPGRRPRRALVRRPRPPRASAATPRAASRTSAEAYRSPPGGSARRFRSRPGRRASTGPRTPRTRGAGPRAARAASPARRTPARARR